MKTIAGAADGKMTIVLSPREYNIEQILKTILDER